ncbi:glutathione synthetase ATP-binding domain-like protein [Aspergillus ibericus CBS 121593]|uniref:Glutathione synthetase ATP-binding domain-like protein n=1 Tax=Aspergillus ibericus CBS 121593 TaxID=1448316 RepID=A0A395GWZ9_9EURO|nr:glutathione synthetase ATP-binding domain-like protein [Aspergillus ibericus CBS 121593]RAK99558.1 glutathione synthetase ATP-binding domain-like protein [Aspergillus ibericus CBS 121593]
MSPSIPQISRSLHSMARTSPVVAVLYQALEPPIINGARKPRKPGGYQDSGADIAYTLRNQGIRVLTPTASPNPKSHEGWCFPDTETGILSAIHQGATHLWANTILFSSHPLQTSQSLTTTSTPISIIGQPPTLVESFDDKAYLNHHLRLHGSFTLPQSWLLRSTDPIPTILNSIPTYPVVGKPVCGRGSHGVKVCHNRTQLSEHITTLLSESPIVMIEQFLTGEEATITVMPPSPEIPEYWALPPITRFNHINGVAPYNGVVAVSANSRAVTKAEMQDPSYGNVMRQCENVARLIGATAPIRVDVRRVTEGGEFAIFDVNMKPNMTGPGRPGREDQTSLTGLAAAALGWEYGMLLHRILDCARPLDGFRTYRDPFV